MTYNKFLLNYVKTLKSEGFETPRLRRIWINHSGTLERKVALEETKKMCRELTIPLITSSLAYAITNPPYEITRNFANYNPIINTTQALPALTLIGITTGSLIYVGLKYAPRIASNLMHSFMND